MIYIIIQLQTTCAAFIFCYFPLLTLYPLTTMNNLGYTHFYLVTLAHKFSPGILLLSFLHILWSLYPNNIFSLKISLTFLIIKLPYFPAFSWHFCEGFFIMLDHSLLYIRYLCSCLSFSINPPAVIIIRSVSALKIHHNFSFILFLKKDSPNNW